MSISVNSITKLLPNKAGRGRPNGVTPNIITIHVQEGMNDLSEYFKNVDADSTMWSRQDGVIVRLLNDEDTPWTNGDLTQPLGIDPSTKKYYKGVQFFVDKGIGNSNAYALTIEHQGFANTGFSAAQIDTSARQCAVWCLKFNIPPTRDYIIAHADIGPHKQCPGALFPWNNFINKVQSYVNGEKQLTNPANRSRPFSSIDVVTNTPKTYIVSGPILDYFEKNGDISHFGLPITSEFDARLNNLSYQGSVQWFERSRLEYHDNDKQIYEGRVGAELVQTLAKAGTVFPK